jgi:hypothetical protein
MKSIVQRGALGVSFAIKSVDEKARRFTGLASTWQKDLGDDVIHKGAFKKTLADWRGSQTKTIPLLDSHDRWSVDSILGKMIDGAETSDGLETEFEMKLREVSLVVFPMNEGARVDPSSVKSLLDAAKAGQLTDQQKAELLAYLQPAAATPAAPEAPAPDAPKGLAPDDPKRIALSDRFRDIKLRSLSR